VGLSLAGLVSRMGGVGLWAWVVSVFILFNLFVWFISFLTQPSFFLPVCYCLFKIFENFKKKTLFKYFIVYGEAVFFHPYIKVLNSGLRANPSYI